MWSARTTISNYLHAAARRAGRRSRREQDRSAGLCELVSARHQLIEHLRLSSEPFTGRAGRFPSSARSPVTLLPRQSGKLKPKKESAKRASWVVALGELEAPANRHSLADGKKPEYFDAVSDCVMKCLGARYGLLKAFRHGFDGILLTRRPIEMCARSSVACSRRSRTSKISGSFSPTVDLVKFARLVPTEDDCLATYRRQEASRSSARRCRSRIARRRPRRSASVARQTTQRDAASAAHATPTPPPQTRAPSSSGSGPGCTVSP